MKKKMLSAFLCAAMAVTLVAGCGAPAADAGKAGQTFIYETLLVWCEHKRSGAADADK